MKRIRAEFTTEPFVVGSIPEHAKAAEAEAKRHGLTTDFGPFGTSASGERNSVMKAIPDILNAAIEAGAKRITLQITTSRARPRPPGIHDVLERLLLEVEVGFGSLLVSLSREEKQRAVQVLSDRGAFSLRGSVEDVADRLGVSRFTVYNYLNAENKFNSPSGSTKC
jgi:uncharacterized protein YqgV (UPF0045/DUF77 family)